MIRFALLYWCMKHLTCFVVAHYTLSFWLSWGTDIKRFFSSCKEYGIRELELLEIGDSFRVNLYRPPYSEGNQKI